MGFPGRTKVRLHAEVHLGPGSSKPGASALGEMRRLRYLSQTEDSAVKTPRLVLLSRRHGQLDVMNAYDAHVKRVPTIATLLLAVAGPPVVGMLGRRVEGPAPMVSKCLPFDFLFLAIGIVVLYVVVRVERQPLASIGLKPLLWSSLGWGIALLALFHFVVTPALLWLLHVSGLPGYQSGLQRLMRLPSWYRFFAAVNAGVLEELLYRGYAIERLAWFTGSRWLGGAIATILFGVVHIPSWGIGPALVAFGAGAVGTLFYLWKRELAPLMIGHVAGDAIGLLLMPPA